MNKNIKKNITDIIPHSAYNNIIAECGCVFEPLYEEYKVLKSSLSI